MVSPRAVFRYSIIDFSFFNKLSQAMMFLFVLERYLIKTFTGTPNILIRTFAGTPHTLITILAGISNILI
jgi:hypothetical protein